MYNQRLTFKNCSYIYIYPTHSRMKKLLILFLFLSANIVVHAQDSIRIMRSFAFGYQYTQFNGLSDKMQTNYGSNFNINSGAFVFSLSDYIICHRLMFGGDLGGFQSTPSNDDNMSAKVMQGFAYFNFGYLVIDKPGFMAYPFAGIGGVYSGVTLKNKTTTDWTTPDYTIKAGQHGYFSNTAVSFNLGIGLKKTVRKLSSGRQMQLGVDLGVHITPTNKDFMYDGTRESVSSFGSANNIGYYAKFTIGGVLSAACSGMKCGMK